MFVPCGFLWLLSPLEYMLDKRHPSRTVPTSILFLAKLAATAILVAIALTELGNDIWLQANMINFLIFLISFNGKRMRKKHFVLINIHVVHLVNCGYVDTIARKCMDFCDASLIFLVRKHVGSVNLIAAYCLNPYCVNVTDMILIILIS